MLMHCTMEELIAIREGRGPVAAREHADGCDECQAELELLHQRVAALKALPSVAVPRQRWDVIRATVVGERRRRWFGRLFAATGVAAASLALVLAGRFALVGPAASAAGDEVASLAEEARELEVVLRELETASRVMNARMALAVSGLEDRLAVVDSRLASLRGQRAIPERQEMVELWRARVDLMGALVQVRATRATPVGF